MYQYFLQNVPLSRIRHNDLSCYVAEGFGGAPVEAWPIHTFFKQYIAGEKEVAQENFEKWYKEQLEKYQYVPKAEGGMYEGSLYQFIEKHCKAPFSEVKEDCKNSAIRLRVAQRFQLLEDIKKRGYKMAETERIDAVRKNGFFYLKGGHHRVALLFALGWRELPGVLVFSNQLLYNLFCFLRNNLSTKNFPTKKVLQKTKVKILKWF